MIEVEWASEKRATRRYGNRLRALSEPGWIISLALFASIASARPIPPVTGPIQAARWLGLAPGARWSWSFYGHGKSGPERKMRSCEFRTSVEDKVLALSSRGNLLRVELDRRVGKGKGKGDRCDGLLPVPESERVLLLIGSAALLRNATRNWNPGWTRLSSGIGVHAVLANARRPLVDDSSLLWVMPIRAGVSWLVDPWEDTPEKFPRDLQKVRMVEESVETVKTAGGSWHGCFWIITRLSANTAGNEWICKGTGVVRSQEYRSAGSLRYHTDLQLTRFVPGREE